MPQNVPQNGIYLTYVPHVPHLGHKWGTECSDPQDGQYLIFLKNLTTPIFYLGLIYRWFKGLKPKNDKKQYGMHKLE